MDGLPQPVRFRLEEWMREIGRVKFMEVALLACDKPKMRERLQSIPSVRREVLEALGDRWLDVRADVEPKLRQALEEWGIVPLTAVRRPSGLASEHDVRRRRRASTALLGRLRSGTDTYGLRLGEQLDADDGG